VRILKNTNLFKDFHLTYFPAIFICLYSLSHNYFTDKFCSIKNVDLIEALKSCHSTHNKSVKNYFDLILGKLESEYS